MPLYSDHYYYGSGQPPPYYLSSSPYTPTSSRISSPYSYSYLSPVSAMLSAGIGTNPMPRGLRSYSPMLSAISETGSPLMSRRDIGNRSSPHYGGKNYYRQRPVVIDTDKLDLSKRKKEDNEEVESTPGMISRSKTIVRMHTRKLKENPALKKKKTQAEILMEKYFIKDKPVNKEELPKRKRIWEEREEELNNTLARRGTIKRTNTVHKRLSSPVPTDEVDTTVNPEEIIPIRKMSIDSELFKEEEALLDCMIQEELGLSNLKEMKISQNDDSVPDSSATTRRESKTDRDQLLYRRRKSSLGVIVDENGVVVGKRKSHVRKKKTSKPLPLDELNMSESQSGSDSSSKEIKDESRVKKRKSTKKKKAPKFKIDSLLVEEKSSPKMLKKFQYEVFVEEGNSTENSPVKLKSVKHINKEDIPQDKQQRLSKEDSSVKNDIFTSTSTHVAAENLSSNICDSKCDTLVQNVSRTETIKAHEEKLSEVDCKNKIVNTDEKIENVTNKVALKGNVDNSQANEDQVKKPNIKATKSESQQSHLKKLPAKEETEKKEEDLKLLLNKDSKSRMILDKTKQSKAPDPAAKTIENKTKQGIISSSNKICENIELLGSPTDDNVINIKGTALESSNSVSILQNCKLDDSKRNILSTESSEGKLLASKQKSLTPVLGRKAATESPEEKVVTAQQKNLTPVLGSKVATESPEEKLVNAKQKCLTPDLGRKLMTNITPKSEPNSPIMSKRLFQLKNKTESESVLHKGDQEKKVNMESIYAASITATKTKSDKIKTVTESKVKEPQLHLLVTDKKADSKGAFAGGKNKITSKKENIETENVKNKKENIQQVVKADKTIDGDKKKEIQIQKVIPDLQNKELNKIKDDSTSNIKNAKSAADNREASKDNAVQLKVKDDKTVTHIPLTKDKQLGKSTPSNTEPKEKSLEKEFDCNSNTIIKTKNMVLPVDKVESSSKNEFNDIKSNVGSALKTEINNKKEMQVKSSANTENTAPKNRNFNKIVGKDNTNAVSSKNALETNKSDSKTETAPKNSLENVFKKDNNLKTGKNTETLTKSIETIKDCNKNNKATEPNVEDKKNLTKAKNTPSNKDDVTLVKVKTESQKPELDLKSATQSNLEERKDAITGNTGKQIETKQTDTSINLLKENKQDKTVKTNETKQTETKLADVSSKQLKLPVPKSQEKLNEKNVKNKADLSIETRNLDKKLIVSKDITSKDQSCDKIDSGKDANKLIQDKDKTIKANTDKKKRIKSESDILDDECSDKANSLSKEGDAFCEKSQSLKESSTVTGSKKKKKSKDKDSFKKKKNNLSNEKSSKKKKEQSKTENIEIKEKTSSTELFLKTTSSTIETVVTSIVNNSGTTGENENTSRELSKRSTRLLHFINKCMRLSEDDENIVIEYSDEDESSSSSECTTDSDYTSDSEEDTLTEDSSDECDVNCHRKCEKLMPNLCGVNQKLIVEALSSLRKGSSESRDHGSPTRRHSNAALSLDEDSPRHGSGSAGAGRVTPPATTIPKFRKYTMDDFQFLKVLGKGSFGKVLLAELRGTQYYYAVKCLKKDVVLEDDDVECTLIERKVLALGTNHPYLCHLFCTFQTESHLFFVMEYLNGGDLMFHIQQQGRFDEGRARFYAAEIVSGLKFLHKKGIVYRDLKLDNILLDFDGHVRIADFGMCKLQIYLDRTADTFCGTPDYMAPEILKGLKYNQCVDWWSFGILMYEMLVGESPFSGCDEDDLFWCICNRQPHYPRFITLEAKRILMQLLEKEASKRLGSCENGALEVMAHQFFNGMDWDRLERRELVPPFKPNVKHPLDVHYFDKHFTAERACLTPIDPSILQSMDQTQFQGFSYTNPNVTD